MCTEFIFPAGVEKPKPPPQQPAPAAPATAAAAPADTFKSAPLSGRTMDFSANLPWLFTNIQSGGGLPAKNGDADGSWVSFPAVAISRVVGDALGKQGFASGLESLSENATEEDVRALFAAQHPKGLDLASSADAPRLYRFGTPATIAPPSSRAIKGISIDVVGYLLESIRSAVATNVSNAVLRRVIDVLLKWAGHVADKKTAFSPFNPHVYNFNAGLCDAINEKGLSAAALWLPTSFYPEVPAPGVGGDAAQDPNTVYISAIDIVRWAVTRYDDIGALSTDLFKIKRGEPVAVGTAADGSAVERVVKFWNPGQVRGKRDDMGYNQSKTPLHFIFHDLAQNSLVLEFEDQELSITDHSGLGVLTNRPFINWHVENLGLYLTPSPVELNSKVLIKKVIDKNSNGAGFCAVPASVLSPHRFVRTVLNLNNSIPIIDDIITKSSQDPSLLSALLLSHAANVIKSVCVPRGTCLESDTTLHGDWTQWEVVRDHGTFTYYLSTPASMGYWKEPEAWGTFQEAGVKSIALPSQRPAGSDI